MVNIMDNSQVFHTSAAASARARTYSLSSKVSMNYVTCILIGQPYKYFTEILYMHKQQVHV